MSELPPEVRELLEAGKRAHEPDAARLDAVYQRVVYAPHVQSKLEVEPPAAARVRLPWGSILAAGALAVTSWWAISTPQVAPSHAPSPPSAAPSAAKVGTPPVAEAGPRGAASPRATAPTVELPTSVPATAPDGPKAKPTDEPPSLPLLEAMPESALAQESPALRAAPIARGRRPREAPQPVIEPVLREEVPPAHAPREPSVLPSNHGWEELEGDGDARMYKPRAPTVVAATRAQTDSLGDEVRWLVRARQALEHGDWQAAQTALEEHQFAHPLGQLQAERRALLARARCLAGDLAGARRLFAQLKEQGVGTSLLRSVQHACPALAP